MTYSGVRGSAIDLIGLRSGSVAQNFAHNTWTVVSVSGPESHDGNGITVASSVVTLPVDGVYALNGYVRWDASATGRRVAALETYTGGAPTLGSGLMADLVELGTVPAGAFPSCSLRVDQYFDAGTKIRLIVLQTSGGVLGIRNDFNPARFDVRRVA